MIEAPIHYVHTIIVPTVLVLNGEKITKAEGKRLRMDDRQHESKAPAAVSNVLEKIRARNTKEFEDKIL
jgi:hypothetical protein